MLLELSLRLELFVTPKATLEEDFCAPAVCADDFINDWESVDDPRPAWLFIIVPDVYEGFVAHVR